MISKVFPVPQFRARTKQIHILGASMGGRRNLGITNQILCFFLAAHFFQFFIQHGHLLVSLLPKIPQDLLLPTSPTSFSHFFFHP